MAKKKILLLSDDLRMTSGIGTMSREFVLGTVDKYDWVQLGAAIKHPDHGKIIDISQDVQKETGVSNAYVKIYPHNGYGNAQVLQEIMNIKLSLVSKPHKHFQYMNINMTMFTLTKEK